MDGYVLSAARNINFIHANKNEKETKKSKLDAAIFTQSSLPHLMHIQKKCPELVKPNYYQFYAFLRKRACLAYFSYKI